MTADPSMVQMGDAFLSSGGHGNVRQASGFHCIEFSLSRFCLEHGLGEFEQVLRSHDFDSIPALASITKEDLVAMGITKLGSQRKIDLGLQALRTRYEEVFRDTFGGQPNKVLSRSSKALSKAIDPRVPRTSSGRTHPRCRQGCCMFIVRSADGSKHKCDPKRIGHSWADCPTKNEKAKYHAEEVALERANKKLLTPTKRRSSSSDRDSGPVAFAQAKKRQKLTKAPGWEEYREEMLHLLREKLPGVFMGLQNEHTLAGDALLQAADLALTKQYSELTQKYLQLKAEKGPYSRHVRKDTVIEAVVELLGIGREEVLGELVAEISNNKSVGLLPADALQTQHRPTPGTEEHCYVQQHMEDVMGLPVPPQLTGGKGEHLHSIAVHDI